VKEKQNMTINPIAMPFDQTSSASQTGSTGSNGPTSDSLANSSSDLFLQLLVAQLKTQDPTSPMDPTQMVGQMLSMNQLNELIQIRQLMQGGNSTTPSQPTTTPTGA
jgi:flagellar basal-body rod modification protein FlgD